MTRITIDVDPHELTALTSAVEEYRHHTSARGELLPHLVTERLQAKIERTIERTLYPPTLRVVTSTETQ